MPVVPIRVVTITDEHPGIRQRQLNDITRYTHQAMGEYWVEKLLPEHFEASARLIFHHVPRKTQKAKEKKARFSGKILEGGTRDLVRTGLLRDALLKRRQLVTSSPTRTTITLVGPTYFKINYKPGRPNLGREVTAMSGRHERLIEDEADRAFRRKLREVRATRIHKTK